MQGYELGCCTGAFEAMQMILLELEAALPGSHCMGASACAGDLHSIQHGFPIPRRRRTPSLSSR